MEEIKYKNMIELIYQAQEKILDEKMKRANRKVKEQIKNVDIKGVLKEAAKPNELQKVFERIEENYSIKISEYNKEFYKQGFLDGVNLMINCLK